MQARELGIAGAIEFVPSTFPDHRGQFAAPFQRTAFRAAVGHDLALEQVNRSVSHPGVLRGVHYADVPPGQAKYVYCAQGAVIDVVVDLRSGSSTFANWVAVRLDDAEGRAVYVAEGLGHAFLALGDDQGGDSVVCYLCNEPYRPASEHGVDPLDPELAIPWSDWLPGAGPVLSAKDREAPALADAVAAGALPSQDDCLAHYERLRED